MENKIEARKMRPNLGKLRYAREIRSQYSYKSIV